MPDNELHSELLGISSVNPFFNTVTGARNQMFTSHFTQRLLIEEPTESIIQSGTENELGKYCFNIKMPDNGKIIKIIERYNGIRSKINNDPPEILVIYQNIKTHEVGCFSIPKYLSQHQYFAYKIYPTSFAKNITPGKFIEKDTVLFTPNSVPEEGGNKYGISLNIALMSHPAVSEDSVLICEDVLPRLKFTICEKRTVQLGTNTVPLNLYGDENNFKAFPNIGEYLRDDGLLMVLRKIDIDLVPVTLGVKDISEIDYMFDKEVNVKGPGGKVIDIKVYHKNNPVSPTLTKMTDQLDMYSDALISFYKEILDTEYHLSTEYKKFYGDKNLPLSKQFHQLVTEALVVLDPLGSNGKYQELNLLYKKNPLDDYRIDFIIQYEMTPTIGNKITDKQGGKGVICAIEKPENMPVDEDGNRADIIMDPNSVIARTMIARLYETYFSSAARDVNKRIKKKLNVTKFNNIYKCQSFVKNILNTSEYQETKLYLLSFYKTISDIQYNYMSNLSEDEFQEHFADVLYHGIYIYYPTNNNKELIEIVKEIEVNFKPTYGPVTYVGASGQKVKTKTNVRISPIYIMLLEKIADSWNSVSSSKLQHFGFLSPRTESEKYSYPWRNSPVKTISEDDGRIFVSYCGTEALSELIDRSNNVYAHMNIVKNILESPTPGNIQQVIDRNLIPIGNSKPLQLFKHFGICNGWKLVYEPESK